MLFNGPNNVWMARARPLRAFHCDAVFHIADALHARPESGFSQRKRKAARVRLKSPDLPQRRRGFATTLDLIDREAALVAFYERLIATAERHGQRRALAAPFPYFRVTPTLLEADEPVLAFFRIDDVPQTRAVLTALAGARADGAIWQDFGQNWFIKIVRRHGALFIVEGDIEDDERFVALRADAGALSAQAGAALTRLDALHRHLTQAFGRDFWTYAG